MEIPNVHLVSEDGYEFFVSRECAKHSGTLRTMLEGQPSDEMVSIPLHGISGKLLEIAVDYMYFRQMFSRAPCQDAIPNFEINPACALELLLVCLFLAPSPPPRSRPAHYLDL